MPRFPSKGFVRNATASAALLLLPFAALHLQVSARAAAATAPLPLPATDMPAASGAGLQTIVLSGGCFWGVQGVFQHVKGVTSAVAGYDGGTKQTADYETVSTGTTGHAESVRIRFDPQTISLGRILRIFFTVALDPTELNRQGPDTGTQYRSEIFYTSDAQRQVAQAYIAQLDAAHAFPRRIATRVDPDAGFYPAEDYHQDYLFHHPDSPYIAFNDLPKIDDLKRLLPSEYVEKPALVRPTETSSD
jgi:peptide-methionine (S)-S-oxide reductase